MAIEVLGTPVRRLIVRYGCRTSLLKVPLPKDQSEAIVSAFREKWPDLVEGETKVQHEDALINIVKRYYVGVGQVDVSSLIVKKDALNAVLLRIVTGEPVDSGAVSDPWARDLSQKAMAAFLAAQSALTPGYRYYRAGKIFEIELAPIAKEELPRVMELLVGRSAKVQDLEVAFTKIEDGPKGRVMNLRHSFKLAVSPEGFYSLNINLDVNNRQMSDHLDPQVLLQIWQWADNRVPDCLEENSIWPEATE
ncbi:MAG: hypothetical protein O7H41_03425 [Planctomycetota bacterium]|nr:hypothetical protein [Planctomycetota bacterium]